MSDFIDASAELLPPIEVERFLLLVRYGNTGWSTAGILCDSMEEIIRQTSSYSDGTTAFRVVRVRLPIEAAERTA